MRTFFWYIVTLRFIWNPRYIFQSEETRTFESFKNTPSSFVYLRPGIMRSESQVWKSFKELKKNSLKVPYDISLTKNSLSITDMNDKSKVIQEFYNPEIHFKFLIKDKYLNEFTNDICYKWCSINNLDVFQRSTISGYEKLEHNLKHSFIKFLNEQGVGPTNCTNCSNTINLTYDDCCGYCGYYLKEELEIPDKLEEMYEEITTYEEEEGREIIKKSL